MAPIELIALMALIALVALEALVVLVALVASVVLVSQFHQMKMFLVIVLDKCRLHKPYIILTKKFE